MFKPHPVFLPILLSGCFAKQATVDQLQDRLVTVEARLAMLEKSATATPAAPTESDETKANQLLSEARNYNTQFDTESAKNTVAKILAQYPNTRAARSATRLKVELDIVGIDAGELEVENWIQGFATMEQGNATLLVFFEDWCPHCKREVPKLEAMWQSHQSRGLNLIGLTKITRSSTEDSVRTLLSDSGATYPVAKETNSTMTRRFGVSGVPAAALVKHGKVVWRGHPARVTDELLNLHL